MVDTADSPPPSRRPICSDHGLAAGPDGRCVLCLRSSAAPAVDGVAVATPMRRFPWASLASAALLLAAVAVGYVVWEKHHSQEAREGASELGQLEPNEARTFAAAAPRPGDTSLQRRTNESARQYDAFAEQDPFPQREERHAAPARRAARGANEQAHPASVTVRDALGQLEVSLYATNWCGYCAKARSFFAQNSIRYTEYDIDGDPVAARRHRELNPDGGVPVAVIDGRTIQGFSEDSYAGAVAKAVERRTGQRVQAVPAAQ